MIIHCPNCNCPFDVNETYYGQQIECSQCKNVFTVPAPVQAPSASPYAAPPQNPPQPNPPVQSDADCTLEILGIIFGGGSILFCGGFGLSTIGLVCAIIACIHRSQKKQPTGRAILGIVLSGVALFFSLILIVLILIGAASS